MTPTHVSPGEVPLDLGFAQKQTPDKAGGISSFLRRMETQDEERAVNQATMVLSQKPCGGRGLLSQGNLETLCGHLCPRGSDKPCPAHWRVADTGEGDDVDVGVTSWHGTESPSAPREKVPSEAPGGGNYEPQAPAQRGLGLPRSVGHASSPWSILRTQGSG